MAQNIVPKAINFKELVKNSNTTLSLDVQTKMVGLMNEEFTESEQQWYIANLYIYMNYHATNDFPINLENVFKMIGFANKGNAMKTIKSNFIENEDYKVALFHTEKRKNEGGHNKEKIMLNVDTFKNLCMIAKTDKGKEIRKYYVKLENIYNKIIKEEIEENKKEIENQKLLLQQEKETTQKQQKKIEILETKPETEGFFRESGYIYIIKETAKLGRYKIGKSKNPIYRISSLNVSSSETSLLLDKQFETIDMDSAEKIIHLMLKPYRIKKRNEWFFFTDETELNNAINTIIKCLEFIKHYRADDIFIDINKQDSALKDDTLEQGTENKISETEKIGIYKGVFWDKKREKWRSELVKDYKCYFLGYYNTELDGAKAYNDYASYLNTNESRDYTLNVISDYIPNPRNIPDDNKNLVLEKKSSKYIGVHYDNTRQHFVVSMRFKRKHINLGHNVDELECAKIYNQQAMYFNNNYDTNYVLNNIENYVTIEKNIYKELKDTLLDNKSSVYIGVVKSKSGKFSSQIKLNNKLVRLGIFENEIDAAKAYNEKAKEFNIKHNKSYKINVF
jgi:phage anti-repressor protein